MPEIDPKPPTRSGYYLLNTDGGMVNDGKRKKDDPPGEAAVGVVLYSVRNGKQTFFDGFSGSIGRTTNDKAEYHGLIEGLHFAIAEGVKKVRIYVDSEFVVDQMNHQSAVRQDDLRDLHNEAHDLLHRFVDHRISWVPRDRNAEADALVRAILYD